MLHPHFKRGRLQCLNALLRCDEMVSQTHRHRQRSQYFHWVDLLKSCSWYESRTIFLFYFNRLEANLFTDMIKYYIFSNVRIFFAIWNSSHLIPIHKSKIQFWAFVAKDIWSVLTLCLRNDDRQCLHTRFCMETESQLSHFLLEDMQCSKLIIRLAQINCTWPTYISLSVHFKLLTLPVYQVSPMCLPSPSSLSPPQQTGILWGNLTTLTHRNTQHTGKKKEVKGNLTFGQWKGFCRLWKCVF